MRTTGGITISISHESRKKLMMTTALATNYSLLKFRICKEKRSGRSTVAA
jgi:hypothetical protein